MSNTVTRRRVELSEGQIIIRRIVVETGQAHPVCDTATSPQAVMHDQAEHRQTATGDRRGFIARWRRRR